MRTFASIFGFMAGEVDKVNRTGATEEVDGGQEDEDSGAENNGDEIEAEMVPYIIEILVGKGGDLGGNDTK